MAAKLLIGAALAILWLAPAFADEMPAPTPATAADVSFLSPPGGRDNPLLQKSREYQGIPFADWMLFPDLTASAIYNDNPALAYTSPHAVTGLRVNPDIYALRDSGTSKTQVYGSANADIYPTAPRDNEIDGSLAVAQTYKPSPDLTLKAQVQLDRLGGYGDGGDVIGPNGRLASLVAPSQSNRAESSAGFVKTFGRVFVGGAVSVAAIHYDPLATSVGSLTQSWRDGVATTLTQRAGYWISPLLYGYGETAENWRNYADSALRSNGYRAVAGLGSDRIGLFRGEVFAGYQTQAYSALQPASASSPVVGAKLFWYPTRALTVSGSLDESFTDSANPGPGNPRGDPQRDLAASLDARYQLHRQWSLYALARFDQAYAIGAPRVDMTYLAQTRLDYELRRNVDLSLSYTYLRDNSNAVGGSYVGDVASLGARYRF